MRLAAQVCAPALDASVKTPLASLQSQMSKWFKPQRILFLLLLATILAGLSYAAMVVQIEHTVTLCGTVEPIVKNEIYAPSDARIVDILVKGGQQVAKGGFALATA